MALAIADRVLETTTTTGTGTVNLDGAKTGGYQTFVAGIGTGNTCQYCIVDSANSAWEVGEGTVTDATPDTLSRTTVLASSNSGSLVNFASGTKDVFCVRPADGGTLSFPNGVGLISEAGGEFKTGPGGKSWQGVAADDTAAGLVAADNAGSAIAAFAVGDGLGGWTHYFVDNAGTGRLLEIDRNNDSFTFAKSTGTGDVDWTCTTFDITASGAGVIAFTGTLGLSASSIDFAGSDLLIDNGKGFTSDAGAFFGTGAGGASWQSWAGTTANAGFVVADNIGSTYCILASGDGAGGWNSYFYDSLLTTRLLDIDHTNDTVTMGCDLGLQGNNLTGDFSNATASSRSAFVTSSVNSSTNLPITPSGTGTESYASFFNASNPDNAEYTLIGHNGTTGVIVSNALGTGTATNLELRVGATALITLHTNNDVSIGNFKFDSDQTVGAGQDNYVLTYDNGTGLISLEAAGAGYVLDTGDTMTGPLLLPAGSLGAPALAFSASSSTGLYRSGSALNVANSGEFLISIESTHTAFKKRVEMPSGSALAPAIAHDTDTNTGIYWGGTDTLHFSTAGSEQLKIDATGRLISIGPSGANDCLGAERGSAAFSTGNSGITAPNVNADELVLEANSDGGITIATPAANAGRIQFADPADNDIGGIRYDHSTNSMVFTANAADRLTIESDGTLSVPVGTYETLVTADDDIPNKKYVDDAIAAGGGGISNVVEDTTPQLGGDLDMNAHDIVGDFTNATLANRDHFRTSTADSTTAIEARPSGSGNGSYFYARSVNDAANGPYLGMYATTSTCRITSGLNGGTYTLNDMTFDVGGAVQLTLRNTWPYATINGALKIEGTDPSLYLDDTNASANEKDWEFAPSGTTLTIRGLTDAGAAGNSYMRFVRSGANIDTVQFYGGGTPWLYIENNNKKLTVNSAINYETLVTADDDIPNKKYVDDAITTGGGINSVVEDTTPQLGADLDLNNFDITGTASQIDIQSPTYPPLRVARETSTGAIGGAAQFSHDRTSGVVDGSGVALDLSVESGATVKYLAGIQGIVDGTVGDGKLNFRTYKTDAGQDVLTLDSDKISWFHGDINLQGNKITADYSNGTLANRSLFQTTTTNGDTNLGVIPNGTATGGYAIFYDSATPDNSEYLAIGHNGTASVIASNAVGTGSATRLDMKINGTTALTLDTTRRIITGAGTSVVYGADAGSMVVSSGTSGIAAFAVSTSADDLVIENSTHVGLTLASPNTATANIYFADPEDTDNAYITYSHATGTMQLYANATQSMSWDSTRVQAYTDVRIRGNDLEVGYFAQTATANMTLGPNRGGLGASQIEFITDNTTYTTYGFRINRASGVNAQTDLIHRGTADFLFQTTEAADIVFKTNNTERFHIESDGTLSANHATYETLVTADDDIPNKKYVDDTVGQDLGEFTVAGLPTASSYPNYWALATDASGGRTVVRSDGTNWKVIAVEGATVTT